MRTALVAVAVIAIGAGLGFWLMKPSEPSTQAATEVRAEPVVAAAPAAAQPVAAARVPVVEDEGIRAAAPAAVVAAGAPASSPINIKPMSSTELADLKLTRVLTGDHRYTHDGRPHVVLGTKDTVGVNGGTQAMLVTRDQVSGQVTYSLPALQFTLNGGIDADEFIAGHSRMTKRFANPMYLQVDLDAADIAGALDAATKDPRVAKVGFVPLPTKKSTR